MLTIQACRGLLGLIAAGMGDPEILAIRDSLMELGGVAMALYVSRVAGRRTGNGELKVDEPAGVSDDDRQDIAERAAMLEFDAKLPRNIADSAALNGHRKNARRTQK